MPLITFPPKFKADQLKQIARLCGKSRSGTKAAISDRLEDDLRSFTPLPPGTRVLSIDLGIRNLAYSLLEVPGCQDNAGLTKKGRQRKTALTEPVMRTTTTTTPILHAWERLALIPKTPKPAKPKKTKTQKAATKPKGKGRAKVGGVVLPPTEDEGEGEGEDDVAAEVEEELLAVADADADPSTTPVPVEDFSPARLSSLAVSLILTRLLPLRPDIVTLEQQRFRSMGGSSVFEWTLRVNSLESMLYAVFTTLRALGRWGHDDDGDDGGRLEGVVARNVLEFMAAREAGAEGLRAMWEKKTKDGNKRLKKEIVGKMLSGGGGVRIAEAGGVEDEEEGGDGKGKVAAVVKEYVEKWGANGKRGKTGVESMKKLDDLADCLLQGLAFIHWQENKRRLLQGGVEALEDQMLEGE